MDSRSRTEAAASEASQTGHLASWFRRLRWWASEAIAELGRLFWPHRQDANGAQGDAQETATPPRETATPPRVTVSDLLARTEAVLLFEARYGCIGQAEAMLDDVRRLLVDDEILRSTTTTEEIEQLWINLLRLGMLDDLLGLIERGVLAFAPEICRFLQYCRRQYDICTERGEASRARHPTRDLFIMGSIRCLPA